jgi:hypothetical protein
MLSKSLKLANLTFEYLEIYLSMCEWSLQGKILNIRSSSAIADELCLRLDTINRWFDGLERVVINQSVVFERVIPLPISEMRITEIYRCVDQPSTLYLPVLTQGMKVTPEILELMFPKQA